MKIKTFAALAAPLLLSLLPVQSVFAQSPGAAAAIEATVPAGFASRKEAVSYAIGVTTARNLLKDGVEIDTAAVLKGMQDAIAGGRTAMPDKDIKIVMNGLVTEMRQKMAANRHDAEEVNKKKGEEFRAAFAKQEGVKAMPNGVLYKAIKTGTGPKPTEEDSIQVIYRGTLVDGKEFDATPEGKATILKMSQLIVGWKEAVKQMPSGSHWTLVVPSNLAYGVRGVGVDIGPNETLVFDVDLIGIAKPAL
jgi:FKBP-type peptidyl-prolyl cis-trans isomerase FklB